MDYHFRMEEVLLVLRLHSTSLIRDSLKRDSPEDFRKIRGQEPWSNLRLREKIRSNPEVLWVLAQQVWLITTVLLFFTILYFTLMQVYPIYEPRWYHYSLELNYFSVWILMAWNQVSELKNENDLKCHKRMLQLREFPTQKLSPKLFQNKGWEPWRALN